MAKTFSSIWIDFKKTMKKADEMESLAADLEKLSADKLGGTLQAVSQAWTGEAASEYLSKGYLLAEKIQRSAKSLKEIAETTRNVARVTYNAEREALQLARTRNV